MVRGFYPGERLRYNSAGSPVGDPQAGDWTTDGAVVPYEIHMSQDAVTFKARRMLVAAPKPFRLIESTRVKGKKTEPVMLEIEVGLPPGSSAEQMDAALAKVFLTPEDDFADQLPEYWKPCVIGGLSGKNESCEFSSDLLVVPGIRTAHAPVAIFPDPRAARPEDAVTAVGHGVTPPRVTKQKDPEFSEGARQVKFQGTMTLSMVVTKEGLPSNLHVLSPLGCGLDAKAIRAVEGWKFEPSMKDGEPVAVQIAVEVDFHLY